MEIIKVKTEIPSLAVGEVRSCSRALVIRPAGLHSASSVAAVLRVGAWRFVVLVRLNSSFCHLLYCALVAQGDFLLENTPPPNLIGIHGWDRASPPPPT